MVESINLSPDSIRAQVQKILSSATFKGARRAHRLLSYVVEETLAGRANGIKEFTVGADALDRGAKFDPRTDATARVEASRLRARIDLYYAKEGANDPLRISLPKGSYVPVFSTHAAGEAQPAEHGFFRGRTNIAMVAMGAIAIVIGSIAVYSWRSSIYPVHSLAVMPFTAEAEAEYVADGLTESLINTFSHLAQLRVTARSVVLSLKEKPKEKPWAPRELGKQLSVNAVLTGKVSIKEDILVVQAELVDTATGSQRWGERYERKLSDLIAVQEDISRQVADVMRLRLSNNEKLSLAKHYTDNPDVYRLYLQGLYYSSKPTQQGIPKAIEYYKQAIEKDSKFAPAYVKLASLYALQSAESGPGTLMREAKEAVIRAIEIDKGLAAAHAQLGFISWVYDLDSATAERELKAAIEIDPNSPESHYVYARVLADTGRFDEAYAHALRTVELDPLSMSNRKRLPYVLYLARRYEEAIAEYQKLIELAPDFVQTQRELGLVYQAKGRYAEALAQYRKVLAMPEGYVPTMLQADIVQLYAAWGKRDEAKRMLADLLEKSKHDFVSSYDLAIVYAGLGDRDDAFAALDRAVDERPFWLSLIKVDPRLDYLRTDARFNSLLRRLNLN